MDMDSQVQAIDKKVTEILHLLAGTDLDPTTGIVHKMTVAENVNRKLTTRVEILEKWKDRFFYAGLGMALPAGAGIVDILHIIFHVK